MHHTQDGDRHLWLPLDPKDPTKGPSPFAIEWTFGQDTLYRLTRDVNADLAWTGDGPDAWEKRKRWRPVPSARVANVDWVDWFVHRELM